MVIKDKSQKLNLHPNYLETSKRKLKDEETIPKIVESNLKRELISSMMNKKLVGDSAIKMMTCKLEMMMTLISVVACRMKITLH